MKQDEYLNWLEYQLARERVEGDPRDNYDTELEERDRAAEKAGRDWRHVARQPHPRERREHLKARQQERAAQLALYPDRRPDSDVTALGRVA